MPKFKCLLCRRVFIEKNIPYKCNSGYRKRGFKFKELEGEDNNEKRPN